MALRRTTQNHTTEAKLLVLPPRPDADAMNRFAAPTDECVMHQSLDRSPRADRKLRHLIILATVFAWAAMIAAVRFFFF
jgi:hypothetical protein